MTLAGHRASIDLARMWSTQPALAFTSTADGRALSDVRVLDLTSGIAGPFCTKVLAGLGAEVIKIERPSCGDSTRHGGPFLHDVPNEETSALFLDLNIGKKSVTLDVRSTVGRKVVHEIAAQSHILIEAFTPGTADTLGIGYEALHGVNPRLTYVSVSNFGQTGPYRDYKVSDMLLFAIGGEMAATGLLDRGPIRLANFVMEHQAGNVAAAAALMAFHGVKRGGHGQHLDLSMFEVSATSADRRIQYLVAYAYNHTIPNRRDQVWAIYPTGIYPVKDGFIEIFGGGPNFFPRSCAMIGQPDLNKDPRFNTPESLVDPVKKDLFDTIFLEWCVERTRDEVMEAAQRESVYCAPLLTPGDVYHDRHYAAREFFVDVTHPVAGTHRYPGAPAKFTETPWRVGPAPLLGQHTEEVLVGRLGYSLGELAHMRQAGVV